MIGRDEAGSRLEGNIGGSLKDVVRYICFRRVEQMQMIASHIERAFLVRDFINEDRTLSKLLGSVMACAGFGLVLATADGVLFM
jgi:hypothetical protein